MIRVIASCGNIEKGRSQAGFTKARTTNKLEVDTRDDTLHNRFTRLGILAKGDFKCVVLDGTIHLIHRWLYDNWLLWSSDLLLLCYFTHDSTQGMGNFGSMHLKLRTALDGIVEDTILHIHFRLYTEDAYALLMDIDHFLNRRERKAHHANEQEHAPYTDTRPGDIGQIIPDAP